MKKNKLFIIPALMVLLLGSCGSSNPKLSLKTKEEIKSNLVKYSNKVDYNSFSACKEKINNLLEQRNSKDYILTDYYYRHVKNPGMPEFDQNVTNIIRVDYDNEAASYNIRSKLVSNGDGEDTESYFYDNFQKCKNGKYAFLDNVDDSNDRHDSHYCEYLNSFTELKEEFKRNVRCQIYSADKLIKEAPTYQYYQDGDTYTWIGEFDILRQITIKESYMTLVVISDAGYKELDMDLYEYSKIEFKNQRVNTIDESEYLKK